MYDWTVLNKTVGETLASGHVGAPVFVRWTTAAAENSEELKSLLAEMSVYAASWLATGPRRLYANGAEAQGHLSLALEYENGSSALLAVTLSNGRPFMSLVILGARGAIYHSDSEILPRADSGGEDEVAGMCQAQNLASSDTLAAIDRSLTANEPVALSP